MSTERFNLEGSSRQTSPVTFEQLFQLCVKRYRFVLGLAIACAVLTAGVSLLVPNKYTATATTLPTSSGGSYNGLMALADKVPGLDMMGLGTSNQSPTVLDPDILGSRMIAGHVLEKEYSLTDNDRIVTKNLYEYFEQDNPDYAYDKLQQITSIGYNKKTGVINIAVTTEDPDLSAQVANAYVHQLDEFNRNERKTSAGQNREFIEKRMAEASVELTIAEEDLRIFRSNNLNYYNSTAPGLQLEHARLLREVELKNEVYLTLAQQRELAAIQEKKETPIIQVLDAAKPPSIKSGPPRTRITLFGLLAGLFLGVGLVALTERYGHKNQFANFERIANKLYLVRRKPSEEMVEDVGQH